MTDDEVLAELVEWARRSEDVRALILESSRAIPGVAVDEYSDWDVIAVVDDVRARAIDRLWVREFGEVLVDWWDPVTENRETGRSSVGGVLHFFGGLKLDIDLWSSAEFDARAALPPAASDLDAGYRVLVDKDGLASALAQPTGIRFIPQPPDAEEFERVIDNFLVGLPYIAKSLIRGDLLPARWVLDDDLRFGSLVPMLWWRVECDHDWTLRTGRLGKGLDRHLPRDVWSEVTATFASGDAASTWEATLRMHTLFERVTREVADRLGLVHPGARFAAVRGHVERMWTDAAPPASTPERPSGS